MDLKRLKAFRAVAKHGSLRAAASRANQTIPAISFQIKKLEDELGVSLFRRLPNKLVLTDRGRIYLREVNAIFEALDRAAALVAKPEEGFRGNLSISLGSDLTKVFAPRIAGFVKAHSGINLNVQVNGSGRGMRKVVDEEVDIAFGFYSSVPRGVRLIKIHETGIQLLCPPGHPLLKQCVTLKEIARYKIITLPHVSMTRRMLSAAFSRNDVVVRNIIEVGGCQTPSRWSNLVSEWPWCTVYVRGWSRMRISCPWT